MRLPFIPGSFEDDQKMYLRDLSISIDKELAAKIGRDRATDQVLLVSPSKKVFSIKVADDGTLITTLVQE